MRIEFLGTGGAISTPRPLCDCPVCTQARDLGVPYSRLGPSTFVHGPDVLIDLPEEIGIALNRSRVRRINACFISHWHPDHVMGRRIFESINKDWRNWPPQSTRTPVYLPRQVARDIRTRLGTWEHLQFLEETGVVQLVEMAEGESALIDGVRVTPVPLAESWVYAFLFEDGRHRVLVAPDELYDWIPPAHLRGVDLAVLPMGIAEFDPFTGERRIPADHPVLLTEATFDQTLAMVELLDAREVIFTHIEEMDGLSHDALGDLAERLQGRGLPVSFAWDTRIVRVSD